MSWCGLGAASPELVLSAIRKSLCMWLNICTRLGVRRRFLTPARRASRLLEACGSPRPLRPRGAAVCCRLVARLIRLTEERTRASYPPSPRHTLPRLRRRCLACGFRNRTDADLARYGARRGGAGCDGGAAARAVERALHLRRRPAPAA